MPFDSLTTNYGKNIMYRAWNEIKAGWKEVRWIWYFSFYLIPITALATLIAYTIEGKFSSPPSVIQILLAVLGTLLSSFLAKSHLKRKRHIYVTRAPGAYLLQLAQYLFSPSTVEITFKPLIADWRYEYFKALQQGRNWKARWVSVRYCYSFILAMSLSRVFSLLKQFRSASK